MRSFLLMLALTALIQVASAENWASWSTKPTDEECDAAIAAYRTRDLDSVPLDAEIKAGSALNRGSSLLFFLHIPRTSGRTATSCLMRPAFAPSRRCFKSYDQLRLSPGDPCEYLSSHDDMSAIYTNGSHKDLAIVTVIRDPVERFLSAYEMGIDTGSTVAMRRFDELTNPERFPERPPGPRLGRGGGLQMPISEIWPWARITPWVAEAILERKSDPELLARVRGRSMAAEVNPYDTPAYPSLKEFMESEGALDLIVNGQLHQILGTTSQSVYEEAATLRQCAVHSKRHAHELLDMAISRMRSMLSVGVFEERRDSWRAIAAAMSADLNQPGYLAVSIGTEYEYDPEGEELTANRILTDSELLQPGSQGRFLDVCSAGSHGKETNKRQRTVGTMMQRFFKVQGAVPPQRSVRDQHIPQEVLESIRELNWVDAALHEEAKKLLAAQLEELEEKGVLREYPELSPEEMTQTRAMMDRRVRTVRTMMDQRRRLRQEGHADEL